MACLILLIVSAQTIGYRKDKNFLKWAEAYFDKKLQNSSELILGIITWSLGYIGTYATFTFLISLSLTWYSRSLHSKIMYRLLHSDVTKFIQRTSIGIILNRISSDVFVLDVNFPLKVYTMSTYLSLLKSILAIIMGVVSYTVLIPCVLFIFVGLLIRNQYMAAQREMRRLELITKSPLVGLAASTISGGPVIRSMGLTAFFKEELDRRIHENSKNLLMILGLQKWFFVRIAIFNFLILSVPLYSIMLISLYSEYKPVSFKGDLSYAKIAFFILSVFSFTYRFIAILKNICLVET